MAELQLKQRRASSPHKLYVGDHEFLNQNQNFAQNAKVGRILFSCECLKLNRKNQLQERLLVMTPTAVHNIKSGKTFSVQKSFRYDEIEVVALSRLDDNFVVFKLRRRPDYIFACGHKMEILNIMKGLKIPVDIIFSNTIKFKISTGMTRYLIFAMQETIVDVKIVEDALGVANKSLVGDESD